MDNSPTTMKLFEQIIQVDTLRMQLFLQMTSNHQYESAFIT